MTTLVAAAIIVENARVLLTQRKRGAHLEGLWEFPGGKIEADEDPKDALARELREELGIACDVGDIVDVTFHRYESTDPPQAGRRQASTDPPQAGRRQASTKAVLLLFYRATIQRGSAAPRALDVAAFEWGDASALDASRFPAADVAVLAKVRAML